MKEQNDNLQPETIDHVIESNRNNGSNGLSVQDRQTTRLIQHLHTGTQEFAQENERSLDRIWSRLAQSQEHAIFLPAQWKQSEEKPGTTPGTIHSTIKEVKVMQQDENVSWGMNPPIDIVQPKKRRSILRMVGLSLVAAVAIVTILSFTVFSGILRPATPTANKGTSTITGAPGHQEQPQQPTISSAKLTCSVGLDVRALPPFDYSITRADWSAQGKIAVTSTDTMTTFSAKDCSGKSTTNPSAIYEASWSPDGTKLVTADSSAEALNVLDSNGKTIANIPFTQLGATFIGEIFWSSDSTKLTFIADEPNHQGSIKSVDANGSNLKTLMHIDTNGGTSGINALSPDGKYALVVQFNKSTKQKELSIWTVNPWKKVSDIPTDKQGYDAAVFSPDSSLFALAGTSQVHIYSTADGKLQSSFNDPDAGEGVKDIGGLAWSLDGKYLAESATSINIYDVNAKKIVTTFGKVDAHHKIFSVAWAPDGSGLVSSADMIPDDGHSQTQVNVWKLS